MLFVAAGLVLSGNENEGGNIVSMETHPDPSVYNGRGSGTRALYELTSRLGYRVDILRNDWQKLPENATMLICAEPRTRASSDTGVSGDSDSDSGDDAATAGQGPLNGQDAAGVTQWLKAGRTLLLMTSDLPASKTTGASASTLPGGDFGDAFGITAGSALDPTRRRFTSFAPLQPVSLVRGVNCICAHGEGRVRKFANDAAILFGRPPVASDKGPVGGEPLAITYAVGKGRVIVIADGYFACNGNLTRFDNATFVTNILTACLRPGEKVLFDEYHHGDASTKDNIWTLLGAPAQRGIVQAVCAMVAMLFVLAPRFGLPKAPADRTRRNTAEYVTSIASLYRGARAAVPALDVIYRQFLRDLCARLALPPDTFLADLADSAARRGQVDAAELKKLLGRCEQCLSSQSVSEHELLDLVRRMEQFRKELGID